MKLAQSKMLECAEEKSCSEGPFSDPSMPVEWSIRCNPKV